MKKIILACDGLHFPEAAFQFASTLHDKNPILLTGVFLPQISYANVWSYANGMGAPVFVPTLGESETETIESNIRQFEHKCSTVQMDYSIRKDFSDLALPELQKESRFADLMIIGSQAFYEDMGVNSAESYMRDALHHTECPIIIVPDKLKFPTSVILAYDGTEDNLFAIKQFSYLFPEFSDLLTTLLYVHKSAKKEIPKEPFIEEWAARHFSDLTINSLELDAKHYLTTWIGDKKDSLLVSGSFGRSNISELFRKSFVTDVIRDHQVPVFIAHK